jgi:hypothetical protein
MAGKNKIIWLILLLAGVAILRLPSLFYPYSYGDQGIYLTLGRALRQGLVLYKDIHDNKPPLLYLLAGLSNSLFWFQALLLVWSLGTIVVFWKLAQCLFQDQPRPVMLVTILFSLLTTWPRFEGQIANAETFMLLPILAGFLLLLCGKKWEKLKFFSAGIFFSLAVLFKVPAGFDFCAALIFIFILFFSKKVTTYKLSRGAGSRFAGLITNYFLLFFGFLLPLLLTSLYFALNHAFFQFLSAGFLQNIGYLSSWQGKTQGMMVNIGFLLRFSSLLILVFFFWFLRKKIDKNLLLLALWLIFSLFGATLSERPYPHYLLQVFPAASLLVGLLLIKSKQFEKIIILLLLALIFIVYAYFKFWGYPTISYYQNFLAWSLKQETTEEYLKNFNSNLPRNQKLASFLNSHTLPQDRIFLWGEDAPCIYALSRRLPPGRFTANYHIKDYHGYQETIKAIEEKEPRFIIILDDKDDFPELEQLVNREYHLFKSLDGALIFFRKSFKMI